MPKQETIINVQFALFFDGILEKPEELWQEFNQNMGQIFDQTPIIVPVPDDLNFAEVPVVQMRSSGIYECNMSRRRVDFIFKGKGRQKFSDIKADLIAMMKKYYNFFSKKQKIKRIGFVTRFFIDEEQQNDIISKIFNNDLVVLHSGVKQDFYFRYVSRFNLNDFKANNFTTIEKFSASIIGEGDGIPGILITRDFNTLPEQEGNTFSENSIEEYINKGEESFKLEEIKNILWPIN